MVGFLLDFLWLCLCGFLKGTYSVLVIVLRRVFGKVKNTELGKSSREALFCDGSGKEFGLVFGIRICGFGIFSLGDCM